MVGGQVSYRPLRCNSHGVQMYHIPIRNKIRCTVKARLSLGKNGSCVFVFVHTTFQKRRMSILCATLSNKHFAKQNSICIDECPACSNSSPRKLFDIAEVTCVYIVATLESDLRFLLGCGEKRHQSKVLHNPILRQTHLHPMG